MLKFISILSPILFYLSFYFEIWEKFFTNHCSGAWLCIPGSFIYPVFIWVGVTLLASIAFVVTKGASVRSQGSGARPSRLKSFATPWLYFIVSFLLVMVTQKIKNSNRIEDAFANSFALKLDDTQTPVRILNPPQDKERVLVKSPFEVEVRVRAGYYLGETLKVELITNDNLVRQNTDVPFVGVDEFSQHRIYKGQIEFSSHMRNSSPESPSSPVLSREMGANLSVGLDYEDGKIGDSIQIQLVY